MPCLIQALSATLSNTRRRLWRGTRETSASKATTSRMTNRPTTPGVCQHQWRLSKRTSKQNVIRRKTSRGLDHRYESSRDRRILRRHCITTSQDPYIIQRVTLTLTAPRHLGPRERRPLGEIRETVVRGEANLICVCACPPCWRRSNVIIHDRRYARFLQAPQQGFLIGIQL